MEKFKQALFNRNLIYKKMKLIRSKDHNVFTNEINKIALSAQDDKRLSMNDNISTLAIGHYYQHQFFNDWSL